MTEPLPVGVAIGTIGATADWWLDSARRLEAAGSPPPDVMALQIPSSIHP